MKAHILAGLIQSGCNPVITLKHGVSNSPKKIHAGMRARVTGAVFSEDEASICFTLGIHEFEFINQHFLPVTMHSTPSFQAAPEIDWAGNTDQIGVVCRADAEINEFIVESEQNALIFSLYESSGSPLNYVNWLESELSQYVLSSKFQPPSHFSKS